MGELKSWWLAVAEADADMAERKAAEYGSEDLEHIGKTLRRMMKVDPAVSNVELGIFFYLAGKIARITEAIRTGRAPSDDSYRDLEVYARMVRRARETGGAFPGTLPRPASARTFLSLSQAFDLAERERVAALRKKKGKKR